jgi:2-polyprenyl-6-methoxyphenol hydroxylase-like FAD-dependent oxidoreductase
MARVLIVGGSLAGLMVANLLHRAGHDVVVLERSAQSLHGRGAGIVTHPSLHTTLRLAGAAVDNGLGVPVAERVVLAADGQVAARWPCPQVVSSWSHLFSLLMQALPAGTLRLAAAVQSVQQTADGVTAQLASGEQLMGDLLIACDGIRSTVRALLAPAVSPDYAGYVAWRGVADEASLSAHTRSSLFQHFGFGLPAGEQILGYPVPGAGETTAAGQRRYNFVWYRPAAAGAALDSLMTDADGVFHPHGIAPQQVSWRHIAALREAARKLLAPQFAEVLEKTAQPFFQPIFDSTTPQLAFARVALLGDAAFVARPHVGMGVTKAADDAAALAECIQAHGATPLALQHYQTKRQAIGKALVQRGRLLGAGLASGHTAQRSAQAVMQQTAIDPMHHQPLVPEAIAVPNPHLKETTA